MWGKDNSDSGDLPTNFNEHETTDKQNKQLINITKQTTPFTQKAHIRYLVHMHVLVQASIALFTSQDAAPPAEKPPTQCTADEEEEAGRKVDEEWIDGRVTGKSTASLWRDKHPAIKSLRPPEHHAGHSIRTKHIPLSQI